MRTTRWAIGLAVLAVWMPCAMLAPEIAEGVPTEGAPTEGTPSIDFGFTDTLGPMDEYGAIPPAPPLVASLPDDRKPTPKDAAVGDPQAAAAAQAQAGAATVVVDPVAAADPPPTPWRVPQPKLFERLGITWGGWNQMGATLNGWSPPSHFNGPVATNDRNEFQLNQFWIFLDRPVNTEARGWDVGGHIDLVYGTDWRFGKQYGLEDHINSPNCFYGLVLPQFYLEVGIHDLSVKMGHFSPGFGYELVPSPMNFFYSHSYAMCYTEPLLVTGVQGEYKLSEQWTLVAGFNRGWMMFEDWNTSLDVVTGVRWQSEDKTSKIAFMLTDGPENPADNIHHRMAYTMVFQQQVTEKFQYVIQHNLGVEGGTSTVVPGGDALWRGINQYFFYQINPEWKAGLRFEWLQDTDGTRVAGVGNWIGSNRGWLAKPGFAGDFYELTMGLNWRPHPNLVLRPEVRWDWYGGTRNIDLEKPFNDGNSARQFTAAADLLVTF